MGCVEASWKEFREWEASRLVRSSWAISQGAREKDATGSGWPALRFELWQVATPTLLLLVAGLTVPPPPPPPPPPPRPCPLSAATVCRVLCTRVHASCMHTRVCRATACCTERSRPALGPYTLLCMYMHSINLHSINPSVSQSCKMQSFPSARSRLSPRMQPTSSLSLSNNRPPWSSGVQCSSSTLPAPSATAKK